MAAVMESGFVLEAADDLDTFRLHCAAFPADRARIVRSPKLASRHFVGLCDGLAEPRCGENRYSGRSLASARRVRQRF
jgi:hypothetical protein